MQLSRLCGWIGLILSALFASPVFGQNADPSDDSAATPRSEQLFERFGTTAGSLSLITETKQETLRLIPEPLFRFSSEGSVFGSVYIWKDQSRRLAVVGTIGSIPINDNDVEFIELHLLKPTPIQVLEVPGSVAKQWSPDVSGLAPRVIPDAPKVAATDRSRMVQMRSLARQFSAQMVSGDQTNQLRLLPQPLYRYDKSTPEYDGALFAFIWDKGTDPEVLLRVEVAEVEGIDRWCYQPIRFTWREVNLRHKEREVWSVPEFLERDLPVQKTPYVTGLTTVIP